MTLRTLRGTDLRIHPLCLGGNVFGWTADKETSFAILDAYVAAGGNFIDTSDVYSAWVPGNVGGESEAILGEWMRVRGNRNKMVIATKVGVLPGLSGLDASTIATGLTNSLQRLGTDYVDLYYAHEDDKNTPLADTLVAFDGHVKAGRIRYIAASNYSASRLAESLAVSRDAGIAQYVALQTHYNLAYRDAFESELAGLCARESMDVLPYYSLASGFLTGKYKPGVEVGSERASGVAKYATERGVKAVAAAEVIAAEHRVSVAAVALAWLASRPQVAAPIASARTVEQLAELLPFAELTLSDAELLNLDSASGPL